MEIPFTTAPRPDTGLYNAQLGIWLFLASEVMLFGALFSAYALLRTGAAVWPHGWERLNVPLGSCNTILTMARGVSRLRKGDWRRGGRYLGTTLILGLAFLAIKMFEYREHLLRGEVPARDNFFAVYFTLTGLHALHVIGGPTIVS